MVSEKKTESISKNKESLSHILKLSDFIKHKLDRVPIIKLEEL